MDRRYDLHRILTVIEHYRPDIVVLQEAARDVPRSRRHDQAGLIAEVLDFGHVEYGPKRHLEIRLIWECNPVPIPDWTDAEYRSQFRRQEVSWRFIYRGPLPAGTGGFSRFIWSISTLACQVWSGVGRPVNYWKRRSWRIWTGPAASSSPATPMTGTVRYGGCNFSRAGFRCATGTGRRAVFNVSGVATGQRTGPGFRSRRFEYGTSLSRAPAIEQTSVGSPAGHRRLCPG